MCLSGAHYSIDDYEDRIIEMAWEDRTSFEVIYNQFGLQEKEVISLMRKSLKHSSFKLWRKRVSGRKTKHTNRYGEKTDLRFKSKTNFFR